MLREFQVYRKANRLYIYPPFLEPFSTQAVTEYCIEFPELYRSHCSVTQFCV